MVILALAAVMALLPVSAGAQEEKNRVYVLYIHEFQEIDPGLARIVERTFADAEADPQAAAVAMVLHTPGGLVTAALDIKDAMLGSPLKTVVWVEDSAWSAGALIATAGEYLYMREGSTIGAAEPRVAGTDEKADYKAESAVVAAFRSTAEARGRDPDIAQAMVDTDAPIPGQTTDLLVLTAREAVEKEYANGLANSLEEALKQAGIPEPDLRPVEPTFSEDVGRFLTQPTVAILLLVLGVIAIGIEFMQPGLTFPGLLGVLLLGLFFAGHIMVGTADWLSIALALIGVLLLLIESFVPGFGIFGVGGAVSVGASIFLAVPTPDLALRYLMWTSLAFLFATFALLRTISRRGLGRWLTLSSDAREWTAPRTELSPLVGAEGVALTVLRPSGTAEFDGRRLDVVTEGEMAPPGTRLKIIRVEGTRVVVRALKE